MLSNRHTDTHTDTHTQTKYCNPRCACAPRVNDRSIAGNLRLLTSRNGIGNASRAQVDRLQSHCFTDSVLGRIWIYPSKVTTTPWLKEHWCTLKLLHGFSLTYTYNCITSFLSEPVYNIIQLIYNVWHYTVCDAYSLLTEMWTLITQTMDNILLTWIGNVSIIYM